MGFNGRAGKILILALLLALSGTGCGRKAMPMAPGVAAPARVTDLSAEQTGGGVRLFWSVAADDKGAGVDAFRVFRARQLLSGDPCPTCPPDFQPVARVAVESRDGSASGQYSETMEKGFRYIYYVTGYSDNMAGPPSNQAVIVYE